MSEIKTGIPTPQVINQAEGGHTSPEVHPNVPYFKIFGSLVVFTIITILVSFVDLGSKSSNVTLAIAIATFKASLVMLFFMHLKYEKRPIVVIAMVPFALAMVLLFALIPDVVNGQYHQNDAAPAAAEK